MPLWEFLRHPSSVSLPRDVEGVFACCPMVFRSRYPVLGEAAGGTDTARRLPVSHTRTVDAMIILLFTSCRAGKK